jgi:hypothetical protein
MKRGDLVQYVGPGHGSDGMFGIAVHNRGDSRFDLFWADGTYSWEYATALKNVPIGGSLCDSNFEGILARERD